MLPLQRPSRGKGPGKAAEEEEAVVVVEVMEEEKERKKNVLKPLTRR